MIESNPWLIDARKSTHTVLYPLGFNIALMASRRATVHVLALRRLVVRLEFASNR